MKKITNTSGMNIMILRCVGSIAGEDINMLENSCVPT